MPLKIIIGLVLIAHGIGHSLGYFPIFGWAKAEGWTGDSWILSGPAGVTATHAVGIVLWTVALVGFVVAGLGVLGVFVPATWIRPVAVVASVVSLVGIVLFWDAFPSIVSKVGAIGIDVVVLWAVLVGHWPSSEVVPG
jgi:hypothetical protein